jgi:hypothetical protein
MGFMYLWEAGKWDNDLLLFPEGDFWRQNIDNGISLF